MAYLTNLKNGLAHSYPMPLRLICEGETASQLQLDGAGGSSGSRSSLQWSETCLLIMFMQNKLITSGFFFMMPAMSFYPGYSGVNSIFDFKADQLPNPNIKKPPTKDEDNWIDEQAKNMTTLPQGQQEKALTLEVCSTCMWWHFIWHHSLHRDHPGWGQLLVQDLPLQPAWLFKSWRVTMFVTFPFSFALLHADTLDCLLPSIPPPSTGLLYSLWFDLTLKIPSCLLIPCTISILRCDTILLVQYTSQSHWYAY